ALRQAGRNRRAHAAGADHRDRFDHASSSSVVDTGHEKGTPALVSSAFVVRRLLPAGLAAAVLLLAPVHADAAARLQPCGQTPGLQCGELPVPLDRTGQTPGTIP